MHHVLITGGSRGIGAACVRAFAAKGYAVTFLYQKEHQCAADLASATGAYAIQADISDRESIERSLTDAVAQMGEIDILVNCAGVGQIKLFTDLTDADWRRMMGVNLDGAFYLCRAVAPSMIRRGWGRIINVGSMWGKVGASCEVHYSAAKAGLRGLTMALAKELGPSGITVNCVEPGVIDTDMNAALTEEDRTALANETPLCRIGRPDEVAAAICFLASDEAGFITGQCLGVDGGFAV